MRLAIGAVIVLFSILVLSVSRAQASPVGASSEDWKIALTVGRFVSNEPTKPDQIFKIQYRVVNGTVENFRAPNEIIAKVNASDNGVLEIMFPRNYPYTNRISDTVGEPMLFINGETSPAEYNTTECFLVFSIPFVGNSEIGLAWSYILTDDPYHGDNVPESCIDQTVSNVTARNDGTIAPRKQFKAGVAAEDIECRGGLELIIQPISGKPYCATADTKQKLIRWWNIQDPIV